MIIAYFNSVDTFNNHLSKYTADIKNGYQHSERLSRFFSSINILSISNDEVY